ncbi:hypothetical protein VOLCADRAFT_103277 [Volvox carteri f. nagariensis]|uniref:YchJ-like middle NTF2-like domain-containing protein n=1 Tax=Volvox carteri f. nagariensis TaxID=3068 RepID=D8TKY1_VOLCA|nr:uncharacterized protein VOLCADRAFT_103277 [Volvox carteri f. nagariensis]EFJ51642.1 hypothetical protein VOLCADRAFT_103277 [Volvox carteri f. nagariensis]|eukprot:XP_002947052.1 hypothetical protein VOLCADRAFT_103277 [Volvox carteri f. nagariensis]
MMNTRSLRPYGHGATCRFPRTLCKAFCPVKNRTCRLPSTIVLAAKGSKNTASKGFGAPKQQPAKGIASDAVCPCGSGAVYEACCLPYHQGPAVPPTPEALLRSRYSAYVAKEPAFIADTTHPDSPEYTGSRASYMGTVKQTMRRLDPLQLTLLGSEPGTSQDEAFITFRLKRRVRDPEAPKGAAAEVDELTERSRFIRVKARWMYLDSQFIEEEEQEQQGKEKDKKAVVTGAGDAQPGAPPKKKGLFNLF